MIRADEPVAGVDGGSFDNGQDVALHAFAADVGTMASFTAGDLVYFVEKNDAAALHALDGHARNLIHIDELLLLFLDQIIQRFADSHFALARASAEQAGQDILEVDVHFLNAGGGGDFERRATFLDVDFHHAVVEFSGA